jgi:hypothetical protein
MNRISSSVKLKPKIEEIMPGHIALCTLVVEHLLSLALRHGSRYFKWNPAMIDANDQILIHAILCNNFDVTEAV